MKTKMTNPTAVESWPATSASIAEAARITGISRPTLHSWKKAGCEAFKGKAVDLHALRGWIAGREKIELDQPTKLQSARQRLLTAQAAKVEFQNAIQRGEYVNKADLVARCAPLLQSICDLTYQKCAGEIPVAMAGLDVPSARMIGNRFAGELILSWKSMFKELGV